MENFLFVAKLKYIFLKINNAYNDLEELIEEKNKDFIALKDNELLNRFYFYRFNQILSIIEYYEIKLFELMKEQYGSFTHWKIRFPFEFLL